MHVTRKPLPWRRWLKALYKKNNQGNQKNYDNTNSNADNRTPKTPVMYCYLCRHTNDPINVRMDFPKPKHEKKRIQHSGGGMKYQKSIVPKLEMES